MTDVRDTGAIVTEHGCWCCEQQGHPHRHPLAFFLGEGAGKFGFLICAYCGTNTLPSLRPAYKPMIEEWDKLQVRARTQTLALEERKVVALETIASALALREIKG